MLKPGFPCSENPGYPVIQRFWKQFKIIIVTVKTMHKNIVMEVFYMMMMMMMMGLARVLDVVCCAVSVALFLVLSFDCDYVYF